MTIPTWQQRLDAMDHSKGTSNVMRQNAMKAEILELRAALREYRTNFQSALSERTRTLTKAIKAHEKELAKRQVSLSALPGVREENRKLRKELARMSAAAKDWKDQALKYQKLAAGRKS